MKTSIKRFSRALLKDESGQSTTEYVLLLIFIVIAVNKVGGTLKDKLGTLVDKAFNRAESEVGQ